MNQVIDIVRNHITNTTTISAKYLNQIVFNNFDAHEFSSFNEFKNYVAQYVLLLDRDFELDSLVHLQSIDLADALKPKTDAGRTIYVVEIDTKLLSEERFDDERAEAE